MPDFSKASPAPRMPVRASAGVAHGVGLRAASRRFRPSDFYWLQHLRPAGRWVASAKAPMEDLQVIGTIQPSEAPLHLVGFDPGEELLWSASQAGMVYAHLMLSGAPHVAFRTDREMSPAVAVFPHSSGLVTLTYAAAHFISRGGVELAEVRHESLGVLSAGVMCASGRTPAVALCGAGTADGTEGSGPSLALMDLSTAQLTVQLPLEIVPTVARWEGRSGLLVLGGGDGLARVFDVRSGVKAVGAAPLFPRGVIHDLDVQDNSLAASALRAQLGPLGHDEYVFDSNLRTADLRQLSRPGAQLFFAPGAAALRWRGSASSLLVASPAGGLQRLDPRGGMTAPSESLP